MLLFQEKIIYVFLAVNGNPTPLVYVDVYFVKIFLLLIGQCGRPFKFYDGIFDH
jgi:hypothetical protein